MPEYHFPVPGSPEEGKIVLFFRKHWAAFFAQSLLIIFLFLFPAVVVISIRFANPSLIHGVAWNFLVLGLSIYYLVITTFSFTAWVTFYFNIYVVTNDAIIDVTQQGLFGRRISQLPLEEVQDVSSNIKGIFPTFFGYGDVLVETASESVTNFLISQVADPQEISSKIMELHNNFMAKKEGRRPILTAEIVGHEPKLSFSKRAKILEEKEDLASQLGLKVDDDDIEPESARTQNYIVHPDQPSVDQAPANEPLDKKLQNDKLPSTLKKEGGQEEGEVGAEDLDQGGSVDLTGK